MDRSGCTSLYARGGDIVEVLYYFLQFYSCTTLINTTDRVNVHIQKHSSSRTGWEDLQLLSTRSRFTWRSTNTQNQHLIRQALGWLRATLGSRVLYS
jgi:hypothetical protein